MSRTARFLSPLVTVALAVAFCLVLAAASAQSAPAQRNATVILFSDNMDGPNNWSLSNEIADGVGPDCDPNPEFQRVPGDAANPTHSGSLHWTNNPYNPADASGGLMGGGICLNYMTLNTNKAIQTTAAMATLTLSVWEHHHTEGADPRFPENPCNPQNDPPGEPPCDFGLIQVSKDLGATWTDISPRIEGGLPTDPHAEQTFTLNSTHYTPGDKLLIRFSFSSDSSLGGPTPPPPPPGPFEGWYIDDVTVRADIPTAVDVTSFIGAVNRRGVVLSWKTEAETDTIGYNVWRFAGAEGVKVNRSLISAKGAAGGTTYRVLDRNARPGADYKYRLQVVGKGGKRAWRANTDVHVAR
jgi:hypothetical protein